MFLNTNICRYINKYFIDMELINKYLTPININIFTHILDTIIFSLELYLLLLIHVLIEGLNFNVISLLIS